MQTRELGCFWCDRDRVLRQFEIPHCDPIPPLTNMDISSPRKKYNPQDIGRRAEKCHGFTSTVAQYSCESWTKHKACRHHAEQNNEMVADVTAEPWEILSQIPHVLSLEMLPKGRLPCAPTLALVFTDFLGRTFRLITPISAYLTSLFVSLFLHAALWLTCSAVSFGIWSVVNVLDFSNLLALFTHSDHTASP